MDYLTQPYTPQQSNLTPEELSILASAGKITKEDYIPPNEKFVIRSRYKSNTRSSRPRMEM